MLKCFCVQALVSFTGSPLVWNHRLRQRLEQSRPGAVVSHMFSYPRDLHSAQMKHPRAREHLLQISRLQLPDSTAQITSLADCLHSQTLDTARPPMSHPGSSLQTPGKQRKKHENKTLPLFPGCGCQDDAAYKSISISLFFPPFLSLSLSLSLFLSVCHFFACFVSLFQAISPSLLFLHIDTHSSDLHFIIWRKKKKKKKVNIREKK